MKNCLKDSKCYAHIVSLLSVRFLGVPNTDGRERPSELKLGAGSAINAEPTQARSD